MRKALTLLTALAALAACGGGVRDDLSSRDQELCDIVLDEEKPIGFLSAQLDELIENDGAFSSEGDAFAFTQVPVGRSADELRARTDGYIDDSELESAAEDLDGSLFDLQLAADEGSSIDTDTLDSAKESIGDMAAVCTG